MNRRSVIGLENRLEKMTMESENQLSELRLKLSEETHEKHGLQEQLTAYKKNESSLISKLQEAENQYLKIKVELESSRKTVKEMEIKVSRLEEENKAIGGYKKDAQDLRKEVETLRKSDKLRELEGLLSKERKEVETLKKKMQVSYNHITFKLNKIGPKRCLGVLQEIDCV